MIIVNLNIIEGSMRYYATLRKEFETDLVPMVGMEIEDTGFKNRVIKHVTINPAESYYYVFVEDETRADKAQCEKLQQMYEAHGWKSTRDLSDALGADPKE